MTWILVPASCSDDGPWNTGSRITKTELQILALALYQLCDLGKSLHFSELPFS